MVLTGYPVIIYFSPTGMCDVFDLGTDGRSGDGLITDVSYPGVTTK